MKPYIYYIALGVLFFAVSSLEAQKKEFKKGESFFDRGEYYQALENFLLAKDAGMEFTVEDNKKLARCYYYLNDVDKAFELFSELADKLTGHDIFLYASTQHKFGFYDGAIEWYEKAQKEGENPVQINELIKSCQWANENQQLKPYRVNPSTIGTFGQSFGIAYYKNGVVYSSANEDKSSKDVDKQGRSFLNLYYSDIVDGQIQEGKRLFSKNLVFPYHVGAISFSSDFNTMYYTKSVRVRGGKSVLKIYSVEYDGNDWGNETELSINSDSYDCAHPAVSRDNKFLYFVSNKTGGGGYGGTDIYYAEIKGKNQFGKVENLGRDINTFGDERFPVINVDNKLYFSSDGHDGFGGLDIYSAEYIHGKWTNVVNLGRPFNSNYDDFGFVMDPNNPDKGFLSSNNFGDHKSDVIFYVEPRIEEKKIDEDVVPIAGLEMIKQVQVEEPVTVPETETPTIITEKVVFVSTIINTANNQPVPGVTVTLKDANSGEQVGQVVSDKNGAFIIEIPEKYTGEFQEFEIELSKGSDFKSRNIIVNIQEFEELRQNGITLTPIFNDTVLDDISRMTIPYVGNEITEEGYQILDKLAVYLANNPGIVVKLNGHTDARGNRYNNLTISQTITEKAKKYVESKGVNGDQMIPRGYGERYLVNRCQRGKYCDEAEHLKNRRIEVVVWNK